MLPDEVHRGVFIFRYEKPKSLPLTREVDATADGGREKNKSKL